MVPIVSAENPNMEKLNSLIEANYVPVDTALNHAVFAVNEFTSAGYLGEKNKWIGAKINPEPLIIYDISGTKLFYLFTIEKNNSKIGEIKIAANKVIGSSVITIGPQENSIDISKLERKARSEAATHSKPGTSVLTHMVIYSYPDIGMEAIYSDSITNTTKKVLIDAYDYSIIPDRSPRYEGDLGIVSFYETYPEEKLSEFIDQWSRYDKQVKTLEIQYPILKNISKNQITDKSIQAFNSQSVSPKVLTEYTVLSPFTLIAQSNSEWCAVTTAQMISQWHSVSHTQPEIAAKMGLPITTPYRGANLNEELTYYQASIDSGGLNKTNSLDYYSINWADSKTEIDNNHPFKVGNNGHARAVIGYTRSSSSGLTYFYFKDPKPVEQGSEYFEWFNELNPNFYNNHIKVK
jgi:hypothetical protein